ncbi:MAG: ABC transporter ATP-binding protein [Deltaproteobacteria bacterium]|nr:ABC transporter ATP-binding protein [Candidatus Zymogenaceae bacterium]
MESILSISHLTTGFLTDSGFLKAVDGVDFSIGRGETIGLVGESGCGKSVTALSIMRLIPSPPGRIVSGDITFEGTNLTTLSEKEMRVIRGDHISMIFQEPMTSLNPVFTIGDQIGEMFAFHRKLSKKEILEATLHLLSQVGMAAPRRVVSSYPHQLSGGQRQRVMIAMALALSPSLMIADEPTTALDVTIQAAILELLVSLKVERRMSLILITHDLGVVSEVAQRVSVMYAGQIVEESRVSDLFSEPLHPYTQGLIRSLPQTKASHNRLYTIPGAVPKLSAIPPGCRFHPRCDRVMDICRREAPGMFSPDNTRKVRCWLYG